LLLEPCQPTGSTEILLKRRCWVTNDIAGYYMGTAKMPQLSDIYYKFGISVYCFDFFGRPYGTPLIQ